MTAYHLIGIGGIGMSALAKILHQRGHVVQGSDVVRSSITHDLEKQGIRVFIGHDATHVPDRGYVVYSTGIAKNNVEYVQAQKSSISLLHRSECLHYLMQGQHPLVVTGTHGKTTTSALLAHVLCHCGEEPSFYVGGVITSLSSQAGSGKGKYFVAEADESDGSFLRYAPQRAIVTNLDNDHLDFWKNAQHMQEGFIQFCHAVTEANGLFWCRDDPILPSLKLPGIGYGFSEESALRIQNVSYCGWSTRFSLSWFGKELGEFVIPLIGRHNVWNAAAVIGLCHSIGLQQEEIQKGVSSFQGVGRRCQKQADVRGVTIYDDYGHHPTEIQTTLLGLKNALEGRRLIVVFQPHRYTRTRDCMEQFATAFTAADVVVITDVYAAGEEFIKGAEGIDVYQRLQQQGSVMCRYLPRSTLRYEMMDILKEGDVLVSMGAGDITHLGSELVQEISR